MTENHRVCDYAFPHLNHKYMVDYARRWATIFDARKLPISRIVLYRYARGKRIPTKYAVIFEAESNDPQLLEMGRALVGETNTLRLRDELYLSELIHADFSNVYHPGAAPADLRLEWEFFLRGADMEMSPMGVQLNEPYWVLYCNNTEHIGHGYTNPGKESTPNLRGGKKAQVDKEVRAKAQEMYQAGATLDAISDSFEVAGIYKKYHLKVPAQSTIRKKIQGIGNPGAPRKNT